MHPDAPSCSRPGRSPWPLRAQIVSACFPAPCEAEQGKQLVFAMFYWLRVQCFLLYKTVYIGFLVSAREIKKECFRVKFK